MHQSSNPYIIPEAHRRSTFSEEALAFTLSGTRGHDFLQAPDGRHTAISARRGHDTVVGGAGNDLLSGGDGDDMLIGFGGDDPVRGGRGNDTLWGDDGNDELFGGRGNDRITGGAGHDILEGDSGNDILAGGLGEDAFLFMQGDGHDVIESQYDERLREPGSVDEVVFRDHYAHDLTSVVLGKGEGRMTGRDLIVTYGAGDSITIRGQDSAGGLAITRFRFLDGMIVDYEQLLQMYSGEGGALSPTWEAARPLHQDALLHFGLDASPAEGAGEVAPDDQNGYALTWLAADGRVSPSEPAAVVG